MENRIFDMAQNWEEENNKKIEKHKRNVFILNVISIILALLILLYCGFIACKFPLYSYLLGIIWSSFITLKFISLLNKE